MKLDSIAQIGMGLVISRKKSPIESESNKEYTSITLKSIDEIGNIDKALLEKFKSNAYIEEGYLTKEGDVIMRLSSPYTATVIEKQREGLIVPSHFAKITVNTNILIPEFLALYLNSRKAKKQILKNAARLATPAITVKDIKNITIKPYDIDVQNKAILINELHQNETKLMNELIREKEKLNISIINELLK